MGIKFKITSPGLFYTDSIFNIDAHLSCSFHPPYIHRILFFVIESSGSYYPLPASSPGAHSSASINSTSHLSKLRRMRRSFNNSLQYTSLQSRDASSLPSSSGDVCIKNYIYAFSLTKLHNIIYHGFIKLCLWSDPYFFTPLKNIIYLPVKLRLICRARLIV